MGVNSEYFSNLTMHASLSHAVFASPITHYLRISLYQYFSSRASIAYIILMAVPSVFPDSSYNDLPARYPDYTAY